MDGGAALAFSNPGTAQPPTASRLMKALGRELWATTDELLTTSLRMSEAGVKGNAPVALAAMSLRAAAGHMLTDSWEDVMGELEVASCSCEDYLPQSSFEGLINLFSYTEPVPQCEWGAARASLQSLSISLMKCSKDLRKEALSSSPQFEASQACAKAAEVLQRATGLFEPGKFYMPRDPRDPTSEGCEADCLESASEEQTELLQEVLSAADINSSAASLLARVDQELNAALRSGGFEGRRALLQRLIREYHPDQNPGKELEVVPTFRFVQSVRERDGARERRTAVDAAL